MGGVSGVRSGYDAGTRSRDGGLGNLLDDRGEAGLGDTRGVSSRRRVVATAVLVATSLGLTWGGLQVSLSNAADSCYETRPGYLHQRVIEVHRRWWTVECVMDPRDGGAPYTAHRPWQSLRAIKDIDGD